VAEGDLTEPEIARRAGVSDRQLRTWKGRPEFADRVAELVEGLGDVALRRAIARRAQRVRALDERWQLMQRVIAERGADPAMQEVPGGRTGLLVHNVKGVGKGDDFRLIDLYEVDVGLLRELREHEKQAAQEVGQWAEKRELSGPDGCPIQTEVLSDAECGAAVVAILARLGQGLPGTAGAAEGDAGRPALAGACPGDGAGGDAAGPVAGEATPLFE
jgi:hypothetical protein